MAKVVDLPELVESARQGDVKSFEELVVRFSPAVRAMCLMRASDPEWADDLSQQIFLTAWRRLAELRPQSNFWAWLEAIARNHLLNEWRRVQRERGFKQRYTVAWLARQDREAVQDEPDELASHTQHLKMCLDQLPEHLRKIVSMRYAEGSTSDRIAEEMGGSADSIRQTLVRLRDKLRDCVERRRQGARYS
ncbi:MAG: sigma-70 family RNA polymerase sigma factor [Planctomycetota bacterium]|nr:sigma-70 family RNA polymerase sigma factor [Planctomycetota bacterium]